MQGAGGTESPNAMDSLHESDCVKGVFWGCEVRGPGVGDKISVAGAVIEGRSGTESQSGNCGWVCGALYPSYGQKVSSDGNREGGGVMVPKVMVSCFDSLQFALSFAPATPMPPALWLSDPTLNARMPPALSLCPG